uniref:Hemicentin 1 n=1 Tax=Varanus komodoensis TaxID=61221 RepID=A0A8D2J2S6_VARKO
MAILRVHLNTWGGNGCQAVRGCFGKSCLLVHFLFYLTEPPRVTVSPKNQTFTEGSEVSIRCSATGHPKPTIVLSWLKDGQPLPLGFHVTLENQGTGLQIAKSEVDDAGRYTCIASNKAGEADKHYVLKVLDESGPNSVWDVVCTQSLLMVKVAGRGGNGCLNSLWGKSITCILYKSYTF